MAGLALQESAAASLAVAGGVGEGFRNDIHLKHHSIKSPLQHISLYTLANQGESNLDKNCAVFDMMASHTHLGGPCVGEDSHSSRKLHLQEPSAPAGGRKGHLARCRERALTTG